jgi:hypothetical protein
MATSKDRNPRWVEKARSDSASMLFAAEDPHRADLIAIIGKLTQAPGLASAWKALENKFQDFEAIRSRSFQAFAERLRPFDNVYESLSKHEHLPLAGEAHVCLLAEVCFRAYDGFKGFVALSGREQNDWAKKVAKQAKELAKSLSILSHPIFGLPSEFDLDTALLDIHVDNYQRARSRGVYSDVSNDWQAGYHASGFDFAAAATNEFPGLLAKLAEGAGAWGNTTPQIAKPNSKDAHRSYFAKCLVSYFSEEYGSPMEDTVLAFTKVFFEGASTLTRSSIAEMTTKKRKRNRASRQ